VHSCIANVMTVIVLEVVLILFTRNYIRRVLKEYQMQTACFVRLFGIHGNVLALLNNVVLTHEDPGDYVQFICSS
jgi:hypothetical protein